MSGLKEEERGGQGGLREDSSSGGGLRAEREAPGPAARADAPAARVTFGFVASQLQDVESAMRAGTPKTAMLLGVGGRELVAGLIDASAVRTAVQEFVKKKQELERKGANFAHLKSLAKAYPEFNKWFEQIVGSERMEPTACSEVVRTMALGEVQRNLQERAREYYENDVLVGKDKKIDGSEYGLLIMGARAFLVSEAIQTEVLRACRAVVGDETWQPPAQVDDEAAEKEKHEARASAEEQAHLVTKRQLAAVEQQRDEERDKAARERARDEARAALEQQARGEARAAAEQQARDEARAALEQQARDAAAYTPAYTPPLFVPAAHVPLPYFPHAPAPARTSTPAWIATGLGVLGLLGALLVLIVRGGTQPGVSYCAITDQTEVGKKCTGKIYNDSGETVSLKISKAGTYKIHAQAPSHIKIPLQPVLNVTDATGKVFAKDEHEDAELQLDPGDYKINITDAFKGDPAHFKGGFSFELDVKQISVSTVLVDLLHYSDVLLAVSSKINNPTNQPEHLVDGKEETAWNSRSGDLVGAWIAFRVPRDAHVAHIEMSAGFNEVSAKFGDLFTGNYRITSVRVLRDGVSLGDFNLSPEVRTPQTIPVEGPGGDYKIQVLKLQPGSQPNWREVTISEVRVIGRPGKDMQANAGQLRVRVGALDPDGASPSAKATTARGNAVELAPDDEGFVDTRGGGGWGDRCWLHIKSGQLGWAKAECNKATEMNPASPDPRASILFNHGLIEEKLGHAKAAIAFYKESLSIRPNATVQSALERVESREGPASERPAPAGTPPAPAGTPPAPTQASSSTSRASCLQACVARCNDDANCERGCASGCPR